MIRERFINELVGDTRFITSAYSAHSGVSHRSDIKVPSVVTKNMLVFPYWRVPPFGEACRAQPWTPPSSDYFASHIARPYMVRSPLVPKSSEDEWSGGSSPERASSEGSPGDVEVPCDWLGCSAVCAGVEKLSAHVAHAHAHPHHDGLYYCSWRDCCRAARGFNARYKMLVHVRTHTNERPHKCLQCAKSFSRAENLKIHIRSHSGEKPYICPYAGCGKAYSNSSDRFKHTRTHKVDKPYRCKVPGCDKRYTDPSSLRKHVKTNKHYPSKDLPNQPYSDESQSPQSSPIEDSRRHDTLKASAAFNPFSQAPTVTSTSHYLDIIERKPTLVPCRPKPVYPMGQPLYQVPILHYNNPISSYSVLQSRSEVNSMEIDNLPLNLKCSKTKDFRPLEILRADLPLDLSTKS